MQKTPAMAFCANCKDSASKRKRINRLARLRHRKLDAGRERRLPDEGADREEGEKLPNTDRNASSGTPGEVLNAEIKLLLATNSGVTWASLLNSNTPSKRHPKPQGIESSVRLWLSESEPDPDLFPANSSFQGNRQIEMPVRKGVGRDTRSDSTYVAGSDKDASNKPCEDRNLKSKATKVGRTSRRSRAHRPNLKENICIEKPETTGKHRHLKEKHCVQDCPENGWEAAADAFGLHTAANKFSNVLQPQVLYLNDCDVKGTRTVSLLGLKSKQQQKKVIVKPHAQRDLHQRPLLPSPMKQQCFGMKAVSCTNFTDALEKPQCLVCTEDLDLTDISFEVCTCGFNICLFCYHKIAQESGRCPGCRGIYKQDVTAKPACLLPH